jgi:hypothetical protein
MDDDHRDNSMMYTNMVIIIFEDKLIAKTVVLYKLKVINQ